MRKCHCKRPDTSCAQEVLAVFRTAQLSSSLWERQGLAVEVRLFNLS